ncbi:MAG: DUF3108 domain-containing protein [Spirochaetia bacterium]|nr:DUF3108 domain-containing protein [Spirochaetia bacterium]
MKIFITRLIFLALFFNKTNFLYGIENSIYNEFLKYEVEWLKLPVGTIYMKTVKGEKNLLSIRAKVESFEAIKSLYYVGGSFGALWNYKTQNTYIAYEDIYQGYNYQKRYYLFENNEIFVKKLEKVFYEPGLPHSEPPKRLRQDEKYIPLNERQDLLGIFYWMRLNKKDTNKGDVMKFNVITAGKPKVLIIRVLNKLYVDVPVLGGQKKVLHVKSGLLSEKKAEQGGDIIFKTQSPIEMYITDDKYSIPVKLWTKAPVLGNIEIILKEYKTD